jgi:flagellar assembly protein FliH
VASLIIKSPKLIKNAHIVWAKELIEQEINNKRNSLDQSKKRKKLNRPLFTEEYQISDSQEPISISLKNVKSETILLEQIKEEIQEAYNQGFADGQETTSATLQIQIIQHQQWLRNIDSVIKELRSEYSNSISELENSLIRLSIMVAEKIIEREVTSNSEIVIEEVRKAIRSLDNDIIFKIRVHPESLEILKMVKSNLITDSSRIENVIITADESVDLGGCILETSAGTVDARIKAQLERIEVSLKVIK